MALPLSHWHFFYALLHSFLLTQFLQRDPAESILTENFTDPLKKLQDCQRLKMEIIQTIQCKDSLVLDKSL